MNSGDSSLFKTPPEILAPDSIESSQDAPIGQEIELNKTAEELMKRIKPLQVNIQREFNFDLAVAKKSKRTTMAKPKPKVRSKVTLGKFLYPADKVKTVSQNKEPVENTGESRSFEFVDESIKDVENISVIGKTSPVEKRDGKRKRRATRAEPESDEFEKRRRRRTVRLSADLGRHITPRSKQRRRQRAKSGQFVNPALMATPSRRKLPPKSVHATETTAGLDTEQRETVAAPVNRRKTRLTSLTKPQPRQSEPRKPEFTHRSKPEQKVEQKAEDQVRRSKFPEVKKSKVVPSEPSKSKDDNEKSKKKTVEEMIPPLVRPVKEIPHGRRVTRLSSVTASNGLEPIKPQVARSRSKSSKPRSKNSSDLFDSGVADFASPIAKQKPTKAANRRQTTVSNQSILLGRSIFSATGRQSMLSTTQTAAFSRKRLSTAFFLKEIQSRIQPDATEIEFESTEEREKALKTLGQKKPTTLAQFLTT